MVKDKLSLTDEIFLDDFRKWIEDHPSHKEINFWNSVKLILEYYYEADRNMTTENTKGNTNFITGIDKFLFELNSSYKENKYFCGESLCCLLQKFVAKLSGI